jgi:UDP-N-acetylglucosamine acyltransferase
MNKIHPTAIIGDQVTLGDENVIGPFAVITGNTTIGNHNWIGPHTCIGLVGDFVGIPDPVKPAFWTSYEPSSPGVHIGSDIVIKEFVSIQAGSRRKSVISDNCYLMPKAHIGHDCWLGNSVLVSPNAQLAGHVSVGGRTVVGMGALVHQLSSIGPVAMVGMGCRIRGQVEECRTVVGEPHRVTGINRVGLSRFLSENEVVEAISSLRSRDFSTMPMTLRELIDEWKSQVVTAT